MKETIITAMDERIINYINELPRNGNFRTRPIENITHISVHHSASKSGQFGLKDFARWHMDPKGRLKAPAICYHFGIEPDGKIYQVNTLDQIAWHTIGANEYSIGIELNGNFEVEEPSPEQLDSLKWLIEYLKQELGELTILGHKQFKGNATSCPGKNLLTKINIL